MVYIVLCRKYDFLEIKTVITSKTSQVGCTLSQCHPYPFPRAATKSRWHPQRHTTTYL